MSRTCLAVLVLSAAFARPSDAQSPLDQVIGPDETGDAIAITRVEPMAIGRIAKAARIPMGIEVAAANPAVFTGTAPRTLTGLTVRAALDVMIAIDARYEWREMNGVIVLRTRAAWNAANHPLTLPVPRLSLHEIRARNTLSIAAAFLGAPQYADTQFGDTKRFSLALDGGTVLDLLNATVAAHGELAWSFETKRTDNVFIFPFVVSLYLGSTGTGCGVPGEAPASPVYLARYSDPPVRTAGDSVLDRLVGIGPNERPLVVYGPSQSGVHDLANATRVPMGIEYLRPVPQPPMREIRATGRRLRDVLDTMISVDPRYEWREMNGVIVIRPVAAWNDPESVMFRIVEPIHMIDVEPDVAIRRLAREVGYPHPITGIPGKPMSLDLPQGTVLDLANAIARTHGELTWTLAPEPPLDGARVGYKYTFTFSAMGGTGIGFGAR